jgi:hypothetical protein
MWHSISTWHSRRFDQRSGCRCCFRDFAPEHHGLTAQWLYNIAWFNPPRDALFTGCVVLVMTVLAVWRGAHVPARKRLRHAAVKTHTCGR